MSIVFGLGNDILTDDGIGPRVVRRLAATELGARLEFSMAPTDPLDLVDAMLGRGRVVVIDAMRTPDARPGDVRLLDAGDLARASHLSSVHDMSFPQALELARSLDLPVPTEILVIGIAVADDTTFGTELSPALAAREEEVLEAVRKILEEVDSGQLTVDSDPRKDWEL